MNIARNRSTRSRPLALAIFLAAVACDGGLATSTSSTPLLSLAAVRYQHVIDNPLLTGRGERAFDGSGLVETDGGRQALTLMVACAMPPEVTLVFGDVEFFGEFGLAPQWRTGAIDRAHRQWVTGCMLAHLSDSGLPVPISMRGRRLPTDPDERAQWTLEEGAFGGDLLAQSPAAAACEGRDRGGELDLRNCTRPDPAHPGLTLCGMAALGDCRSTCLRYAGRYEACWSGGYVFPRMVTTFVLGT